MKRIKRLVLFLLCAVLTLSSVACANDSSEHAHKTVHRTGIVPTCEKTGKLEHWECVVCDKLFADEKCTEEISLVDVNLQRADHSLENHEGHPATETDDGNIEYWTCSVCDKYFADSFGKSEIGEEDIVLDSLATLVDFVVPIPDEKDPIVLQLADPQLIDTSTMRSADRLGQTMIDRWNKDSREELCYKYIRETINTVKPDLILLTGDIIYGEFDDDGHLHTEFIKFMDSFDIPWAPIMGNHDIETAMGADWICEQYESAPNCLFKQGDISGNGNYTVGIKQNGKLTRVFVNMDTNGCTGASISSKANGQTVTKEDNSYGVYAGVYGLQKDQVKWFTDTVNGIKSFVPDVKISFQFHIPMKFFSVAYNNAYKAKVGDPVAQIELESGGYTEKGKVLYPERIVGHAVSDFGYLPSLDSWTPDFWDTATTNGAGKEHEIYYKMKETGVDSIFVGHIHENSISVVYDGIRFQFGQKCSLYDTSPMIRSNGTIYADPSGGLNDGTPLVGGTVIPLAKVTGEILNPYIYFCSGAGKEINWDQYKNTIGA